MTFNSPAFIVLSHLANVSSPKRAFLSCTSPVASFGSDHEKQFNPDLSVSRRSLLVYSATLATTLAFPTHDVNAQSSGTVFFTLPDLPYPYDSLQPRVSEQIMRAHHDAHFATYVNNLNKALNSLPTRLQPAPSDDAALRRLLARLQDVQDTGTRNMLRNNAGGYLNHKQLFSQMSPNPRPLSDDDLAKRIKADFGTFETFKQQFLMAATTLFGSGFVWLVQDADKGQLRITNYANQDNPAMDGNGNVSLLGCDCWEHAWYYQYGPKKADYLKAWWELVDWPSVSALYNA